MADTKRPEAQETVSAAAYALRQETLDRMQVRVDKATHHDLVMVMTYLVGYATDTVQRALDYWDGYKERYPSPAAYDERKS